ncbi:unnamed protein product, partial [Ectocarpus sp. 6 AP-2014]
YTHWDFLPRFLMEEFHPRRKMANAYFLVLASLQTIPEITNTFRVPTILLPLSVVVIVDAVFAILEDVARHRADAKANASPTRALDVDLQRSAGKFRRVEWRDVQVMGAHEPNPQAKAGICYVETKSLDGETNLKIRQAIRSTIGRVSTPRDAAALKGRVVMEHPNKLIDNFSGTIEVEGAGDDGGSCREVIQTRNLLLRGCVLRNTRWVVGLVLNTGPDTKIVMSSLEPPHKTSRLEQRTNVEVWRIVRLLCLVCFLGAVGSLVWNATSAEDHVYLRMDVGSWGNQMKTTFIQFLYLFLLLGNFIPVSLYVSMGTVKFSQAFFMKQDLDMYHEDTDTPALVRTMALNEELGQVSHVFSDKTGTLTQNVMDFRKFSVGGVSYGRGVTTIGRAVAAELGHEIPQEDLEAEAVIAKQPLVPHVRFYDPRLLEDLQSSTGEEQRALLLDFFLALAVCHTVIPERGLSSRSGRRRRCRGPGGGSRHPHRSRSRERRRTNKPVGREQSRQTRHSSGARAEDFVQDGEEEEEEEVVAEQREQEEQEEEGPAKLSASSPDDEALVLGARHFGMEFRDRLDNKACVRRSGPFLRGQQQHHQQHQLRSPPAPGEKPKGEEGRDGRGFATGGEGGWPQVAEQGSRPGGDRFVDEKYEVLRILDFTSARKRMSVIVRDPDGRVRILCKGADSVMIPRLARSSSASDSSAGGSVPDHHHHHLDASNPLFFGAAFDPAATAIPAPTTVAPAPAPAPGGKTLPAASPQEGAAQAVSPASDAAVNAAAAVRLPLADVVAEECGGGGGGLAGNWSTSSEDNRPGGKRSEERTLQHMETYAREGLRTLLVTCADLDGDWFRAWDKRFETASTDLSEVEKKKQGLENDIDRLMNEVEKNLRLLGCTAIEDKLQDGVGTCVDALQRARVKVWMLTGDKEETAINIGVACQLLGPEEQMERIIVNMDPQTGCQDVEEVKDRLEDELNRISDEDPFHKSRGKGGGGTGEDGGGVPRKGGRQRALIIDGQALSLAMDPACSKYFAELAMECEAVVCCRVSPDQKRTVVALVRERRPEARTLAIGDGANDVAMIQAAHIGVGISGQEGMQSSGVKIGIGRLLPPPPLSLVCFSLFVRAAVAAKARRQAALRDKRCRQRGGGIFGRHRPVCCRTLLYVPLAVNASDFAIAQFRFLQKLMLFHGRQNYRRMSKLVAYTFYKNILMAVPMAWYVVANGYSGQKFYTEGGIQFYNIMFTLWPILFLGCFDRDVSLKDTENFPQLYVLGINDVFFNAKVFWSWMSQAMVEAALITFVPLLLLKGGPADDGTEVSYMVYGGTTFSLVVLLANSKILWLQYRWTWWAAVLVMASVLAWFGTACVLNILHKVDFDFFMVFFHLMVNPTFWAVVTLCFTAVAMRDLSWKFYHRWWQPKLHHLILEVEASRGDPVMLTQTHGSPEVGGGGAGFGVGVADSRRKSWERRGKRAEDGLGGRAVAVEGEGGATAAGRDDDGFEKQARREDKASAMLSLTFSDAVELGLGGEGAGDAVAERPRGGREEVLGGRAGASYGGGGGGGGGGGLRRGHLHDDDEGYAAVYRRLTDALSSQPSTGNGGGEGTSVTPATSHCPSVSSTLPLELIFPAVAAQGPVAMGRSRSDQLPKRSSSSSRRLQQSPHQSGAVGTRFPRAPSGGFAYSTDEDSASMESRMILNYVESPLKKTPEFWEAPRPVLDRLNRRRERGRL